MLKAFCYGCSNLRMTHKSKNDQDIKKEKQTFVVSSTSCCILTLDFIIITPPVKTHLTTEIHPPQGPKPGNKGPKPGPRGEHPEICGSS